MKRPKPRNPNAITREKAAALLGLSGPQVARYRRDGLLGTLDGYPSYSRSVVEAIIADPCLTGREAAQVLGVSHNRVSQLANTDRIPVHVSASGRRYYRLEQLRTVANAREARKRGLAIEERVS